MGMLSTTPELALEDAQRLRRDAQRRVDELKAELADQEHDAEVFRIEVAAQSAELLRAELKIAEQALGAADAKVRRAEERIVGEKRRAEQAAAAELRRSIPRLVAERLELAERAQRLAAELGDVLRAMVANAVRLAATHKDEPTGAEAARVLRLGAFSSRVASTLWRHFRHDLAASGQWRSDDQFFHAPLPDIPAWGNRDLVELEQETLDTFVRVFGSEIAAEQARRRIAPSTFAEVLQVLGDPVGVWHLIAGRRRGRARLEPPKAPDDTPPAVA